MFNFATSFLVTPAQNGHIKVLLLLLVFPCVKAAKDRKCRAGCPPNGIVRPGRGVEGRHAKAARPHLAAGHPLHSPPRPTPTHAPDSVVRPGRGVEGRRAKVEQPSIQLPPTVAEIRVVCVTQTSKKHPFQLAIN